jgi:hypothetical protein
MNPLLLRNLGFGGSYDAKRNAAETGANTAPLYTVELGDVTGTSANPEAAKQNLLGDFLQDPSQFMGLILVMAVLWLLWTRK